MQNLVSGNNEKHGKFPDRTFMRHVERFACPGIKFSSKINQKCREINNSLGITPVTSLTNQREYHDSSFVLKHQFYAVL